jgi:hypothetical protein
VPKKRGFKPLAENLLQCYNKPIMTSGEKFVAFFLYFALFGFLIWFPAWLFKKAWQSWVGYVRGDFYAKQNYKLLEMRIPRGSAKSPLSMEVFLHALFQPGGEATWYDKFWKGQTKTWFSLEMVSIEGRVRFFIWTREGFAQLIKTQLYGQFPDIEVVDVDETGEGDYARKINYDAGTHKATCAEIQKKNGGHYPIRTYEGFNLHKDPKEEFKVDPITPVLEYLGSLGAGEQAWIQIGVRAPSKETVKALPEDKVKRKAARKDKKIPWYKGHEMVDWTDAAKDEIKKLTKRDIKIDKENPPSAAEMKLTKEEEEKVAAVERQMAKVAFETNIRIVYVAKKDNFLPANSAGILGTFKQYNTLNLNSFELKIPNVSYPWQDPGGKKVETDKRNIFLQYQARAFFYSQFLPIGGREGDLPKDHWKSSKHVPGKPFIMNTEELATIFHFPGDVAKTPTLTRVEAKKGEAPFNLPI